MANVHTRHGPLPHYAFPTTANAHRDANTLSVPWPPRAPPSPQQPPVPVQSHVHAHDAVFQPMYGDAAGNRRPDGHWVDIPPPIENIATRWQPQDPQYDDIEYLGMAHYPSPPPADHVAPHDRHDRGVNYNARVAQGVPAQAQVIAPPVPEIDILHYDGQDEPADLAQALFDERLHQVPVFNEPAREILRRMANRYLNDPDSQVNTIRMEPATAGRIRVDITLELADLF